MTTRELRAHLEQTNDMLRLTENRLTHEDIDQIVALCEGGMTLQEAADTLMHWTRIGSKMTGDVVGRCGTLWDVNGISTSYRNHRIIH